MSDFVLSVRAVRSGAFVADVGPSKFLEVPDAAATTDPSQAITKAAWYGAVIEAAKWKNDSGEDRGDILFIVHGYNSTPADALARHRRIKQDLLGLGFKGVIVSYDWPSDDSALAYLNDRHRAKLTAMQLVTDGIARLSKLQTPDCKINVHVLGHSTGAYVIREAFDDADDSKFENGAWGVSQVVFAAGDISAASMGAGDPSTASLYGHCVRLTNYSNRHDQVLDISNVKRLGIAPRVGRVGLPPDAPARAVNIDCTDYFAQLMASPALLASDQPNGFAGVPSHSWYFGNRVFTADLFYTLIGVDRTVVPTRSPAGPLKIG